MILLWLLFLCNWVSAQDCSSLQHDSGGHHGVVFGDVNAKGTALGNLAVGGNAEFEQFSAGAALPPDSDWALLVQGDVSFKCGDVSGQVFHGGRLDVGARLDWGGYSADNANIGALYSFSSAEGYYLDMSSKLGALDQRGFGVSALQGTTLVLAGTGKSNEMFYVSCEDLADARTLSFSNLNAQDTTTVIINVGSGNSPQCSMDVSANAIAGLRWQEPTGHILWNFFDATDLVLGGSVVGSVLAPSAAVEANDAHIEGQVIFGSLTGTFFFGANLFRGCIPTDPCTLARDECEVPPIPAGCINPVPVQNPDDACCILTYDCSETCEDIQCPAVTLDCSARFEPKLSVVAGQPGADPCCDTWACLSRDDTITDNDPLSIFCPPDATFNVPTGLSQALVDWEEPEFLYVQSVSRSHTSPAFLGPGEHVIHYTANGYKPGTSIGCYFAVTVVGTTVTSGCNVGGVSYDEGEQFLDSCMRQCVCGPAGNPVGCTRLRKELSGMNLDERARYWATYKAAYNNPDGIIRNHVDNHLRFFSRGLHNNGAFLPWHRGYILQIEDRLQLEDCRVTVPYWNWRLATRVRGANHWGEEAHQASSNGDNRRCVSTGTFGFQNGFALTTGSCLQRRIGGGSAATQATVQSQIMDRYSRASNYDAMRNRLEHGPGLHDSVHCLVGGTMCSARASNDPIFFTHHANIDKIWSEWQSLGDEHMNFYSGSTDRHALMPTSPWTPHEMLLLDNQPGGVRVHYYERGEIVALNNVIGLMTPEELAQIGNSAVGPVGDSWLEDMNMDPDDIRVIRLAEQLANSDVIADAVAMTMRNAVERTIEAPGLLATIQQVATRTAIHLGSGATVQEVTPDALFRALTETFVKTGVVPRFLELQDIILTAEDGSVVDVVTVPVDIACTADANQVCASGQTFQNACEALQQGYTADSMGPCPIPPEPPAPVDPAIDGGASDDYNHAVQKLQECPDVRPSANTLCEFPGLTCYYGLNCCDMNEYTATCVRVDALESLWSINGQPWSSCQDVTGCGAVPVEQSGSNVQVSTRPPTSSPTPRPTFAPTQRPTRRPTARPTRSPTRSRTISDDRVRDLGNVIPPRPPPRTPLPPRPLASSASFIPSPSRPRSTSPVTRPIPPSTGIPPLVIRPTPCPQVLCLDVPVCCPPGSRLRVQSTVVGGRTCQGCSTCIHDISGLPLPIPTCCRQPVACAMITCPVGQEAQIVRPKNANQERPCCDEYRCVPISNPCVTVVCPTVSETRCQSFETARIVTPSDIASGIPEFTPGSGNCCSNIICVFSACQEGTRVCPADGSVVTRVSTTTPPCQWDNCPPVCSQASQMLFCPASGGLVARLRNPATDSIAPCEWQPCPPYEPCTDDGFPPDHCGTNGACEPGRTVFACVCDDNWSGPRCTEYTPPPRPTHTISDRSFGLLDNCASVMCKQSTCYLTNNNGLDWGALAESLTSFLGHVGDDYFFTDTDGLLVRLTGGLLDDPSWFSDSSVDAQWQRIVEGGMLQPSILAFSYVVVEEGGFPPASEARHVIRSPNCEDYIFLTESHVVYYTDTEHHQVPWTGSQTATTFELCPDKCLNDDGERNTCNGNGICVRESGECLCNFGWRGEICQSRADGGKG